MPRAASVAYASVISSGLTGCVPSVIEQTGCSGRRDPHPVRGRNHVRGPDLVGELGEDRVDGVAVASSRFM